MKTSFYFFFWFIIYYLIGLTGSPLLIQNDFFVALIIVFFLTRLDRKLFAPELIYQANLNRGYVFEIFYRNDTKKMMKLLKQQCLGQTIMAIYCLLTIVGLLTLGNSDIVAYVIFGFFGIMSIVGSSKTFNQYREVKDNGLPDFRNSQYSEDHEAYAQYRELRQTYTSEQLLPKAPKMSKWINIASIIFAVACIGGGLFYLILILEGSNHINVFFSAVLIWSVLAIYFGVKDLVDSIRGLKGFPTPTLK